MQYPKYNFFAFPQPQYVLNMFLNFGHVLLKKGVHVGTAHKHLSVNESKSASLINYSHLGVVQQKLGSSDW